MVDAAVRRNVDTGLGVTATGWGYRLLYSGRRVDLFRLVHTREPAFIAAQLLTSRTDVGQPVTDVFDDGLKPLSKADVEERSAVALRAHRRPLTV